MKAIYPDDGDPDAIPGRLPETEGPARRLEVDGEVFALRANEFGGTDYGWLSGPNPGYGFGTSPTTDLSIEEHMANIRGFLAQIDPATGYIEDN